jgi:hypothetical protein
MNRIHLVKFTFFYTIWKIVWLYREVDNSNFIKIVKYLIFKINQLQLIRAELPFLPLICTQKHFSNFSIHLIINLVINYRYIRLNNKNITLHFSKIRIQKFRNRYIFYIT